MCFRTERRDPETWIPVLMLPFTSCVILCVCVCVWSGGVAAHTGREIMEIMEAAIAAGREQAKVVRGQD